MSAAPAQAIGVASNVALSADFQALIKLNQEIDDFRDDLIFSTFKNILSELDDLSSNVKGVQVNNTINSIIDNISTISSKMYNSFNQLIMFLNGQITSYETIYGNAAMTLKDTLAFIDEKF